MLIREKKGKKIAEGAEILQKKAFSMHLLYILLLYFSSNSWPSFSPRLSLCLHSFLPLAEATEALSKDEKLDLEVQNASLFYYFVPFLLFCNGLIPQVVVIPASTVQMLAYERNNSLL